MSQSARPAGGTGQRTVVLGLTRPNPEQASDAFELSPVFRRQLLDPGTTSWWRWLEQVAVISAALPVPASVFLVPAYMDGLR